MTIKVEIDWDRNGDFSTVGDNVTDLVRPGQGSVTAEYGRDQMTALAPTISGRGSIVLDNRDRRFSPRATTLVNGSANPLYGKLKPARPVKITRTVSPTDYTIGVFHTDDTPINPTDEKNVTLTLIDSLADFRGQNVSTQLYQGIRTGQAIGYILDACGWPAALRDLDSGATVIPWWWEDGTDALTALEKIIRSDGPPALLTVGAAGEIVFRDRHHRITRAASITSQGTWRNSGPLDMQEYSYNEAWSNIVNTGTASVDVRAVQELQPVWTSDTTISLTTGEERLVTASTTDPFLNAVPPVNGIDYTVMSGSITTTLLRTSGGSATIKLTAGSPAVISNLQLRAQPVTVAYTVQVSASDVASIADFGPRSFPGDLPWCGPYDAQAVLDTAVAIRSQPLPILTVKFLVGVNTTKANALLARDLSDRVTIVEPETAVSGDFYIESIGHEFTGEHDHAVTFGLEAVQIPVIPVFRFDVAGQGFDQGMFAT